VPQAARHRVGHRHGREHNRERGRVLSCRAQVPMLLPGWYL
jgi:hypothetical protein